MSIKLEMINLILPRKIIEKKYPGGWRQCLYDSQDDIDCGVCWYDDHLFRKGAMNPMGIDLMITNLKEMGFKPYKGKGKQVKWNDACVVGSFAGEPTLPCDWIEIKDGMASLKTTISKDKNQRNNMKKNLPYLNQERLNIIFDHVYDIVGLRESKQKPDNEKFNCLLDTLKAMQLFNYHHRPDDTYLLFGLFNPLFNFERNSEGTTLWLSLILAIKELYGFSVKKLTTVIKQVSIRK